MRVRDLVDSLEAAGWETVSRTEMNLEYWTPGPPPKRVVLPADLDALVLGGMAASVLRLIGPKA